jgi:integrase
VFFYFGYKHEGRSDKTPLAPGGSPYDPDGSRGLTLVQARDIVAELGKVYRGGITDIRGFIRREAVARIAADEARETAAARVLAEARQLSLRRLLEEYVTHLEHQGRPASKEARSAFKHVPAGLAERRASQLGMTDFLPCLRALVEADKGPTARKLRAYLSAAFALALASQSDPAAPQAMSSFGIEYNPISGVAGLSQFSRALDRNLSDAELASYLHGLEGLRGRGDTHIRDALTMALYLGGQRPEQLLRLTWADVDISAGTVTLYDGKGKRQKPRLHLLPLTFVPSAILKHRHELAKYDPRVFATAHLSTLTRTVGEISAALVAKELAREPFTLRDLRRTAETMMAALEVSKDVRAQVQSHGLGGVQDRHYDRHDYLKQKRAALELWGAHLEKLRKRSAPDTEGEG